MAHVHGANAAKAAAEAKKIMDSAMSGMSKMGEGMAHSGMGKMGETVVHSAMGGAAAGLATTAKTSTVKKILTHPVTLIGIGFALGYLAFKYRKDIISQSDEETPAAE